MILVDTSIWIDHFRSENSVLAALIVEGKVLGHPFIVGELALGNLVPRLVTLADLAALPHCVIARHGEVMHFIESQRLFGEGIGYVDAHLLASTQLTPDAKLWTNDKRLRVAADRLSLSAAVTH